MSSTHGPERRDDVAEHLAARAVGRKSQTGRSHGPEAVLERLDVLAEVRRLAVPLDQLGLEVEQVDVAGGPGHEELDHPLRLGRMMQAAVGARPAACRRRGVGREQAVGPQQGRERPPRPARRRSPRGNRAGS